MKINGYFWISLSADKNKINICLTFTLIEELAFIRSSHLKGGVYGYLKGFNIFFWQSRSIIDDNYYYPIKIKINTSQLYFQNQPFQS